MIRVSIEWQGKKGLDNLIRYIENNLVYGEAQEGIVELGKKTADHMKYTIGSSKKRPSMTDRLENNINSEILNSVGGVEVGIGRISQLKTNAPYFEVLDQGGYVPPANLGYFLGNPSAPTPGGSGQVWIHSGDNKDYLMTPKKAIEGIDYIGKAIRNLDQELREMMKKWGTDFIDGAEKASK